MISSVRKKYGDVDESDIKKSTFPQELFSDFVAVNFLNYSIMPLAALHSNRQNGSISFLRFGSRSHIFKYCTSV